MADAAIVKRVTRRRMPRQEREQQMLAAAERAFADRGFHNASMDAIAEATGITKPMLYAYFGSKEGLYRACMARARERLLQELREGVDTSDAPEQQLWHGVLAVFTFVERDADSWAILLGDVTAGTGPFAAEGREIRRELTALITDLLSRAALAEGFDEGSIGMVEPIARSLIGAGESLAAWWAEHPDEPVERVAGLLMTFAWNGLGGIIAGRR